MMAQVWWEFVVPGAIQATPMLLLAGALDLLLPELLRPRWRAFLWLAAALKLLLPVRTDWGVLPPMEAPGEWVWWAPWVWAAGGLVLIFGSGVWARREVRRWAAVAVAPETALGKRFEALQASLGVGRGTLAETGALQGPVAVDWGNAVVYWPRGLETYLTEAEQEQALRHELAHLRRRDGWRELGWGIVVAIFWFHPLVWWAARRMRAIREQCCDETAAGLPGHCGKSYRMALLRVAVRTEAPLWGACALVDPRAPLVHRLALLGPAGLGRWRRLAGVAALVAVAAAWPLASWAEARTAEVAEWVVRPPGSMQLRFMVLERLAKERNK